MQIVIQPDGNVRCVYGEAVDVRVLGDISIARGSHVEPNLDGTWSADMSPVHGPTLGPFNHRSEAIQTEVSWLNRHWLSQTDLA